MNKVVHFEIPDMNYTLVNTGPADEQGNPDEAGYVNGACCGAEDRSLGKRRINH